jgi:hypothetical protein
MVNRWRKYAVPFAWFAVIAILVAFVMFWPRSPVSFIFAMHHAMRQHERFVLYEIDHAAIASELRDVASQRGWKQFDMPASDPSFPPALRLLKPWGIWSSPDYAELEFGGAFGDIGIRAFRPGLAGYGTKQLGDGIWFYSEDGSCPEP